MVEFIANPRRAPRAPVRCRAAVASARGRFEAETEDLGPRGCQLVAPTRVDEGDLVHLQVSIARVDEPVEVSGRVAWVSPQAPWRVGIAFDDGSLPRSTRWFELLVSAYPGLGGSQRIPDRIPGDATIYLGPPPRFLVDFTGDEAMLLRAIASGARIDELVARLRDRWGAAQRALFSLLARQVVTFQRGHAVHPDSWKRILSEIEASLAVEQLGSERPALVSPPPPPPPMDEYRPAAAAAGEATSPAAPPPRGALRAAETWAAGPSVLPASLELPPDDGPPLEIGRAAGASWGDTRPDLVGGAWWAARSARSAEAQAALERGLEVLRAGSPDEALGLLRRALQLAPGDPEIAQALGRAAPKDRRGPQ